MKYIRVYEGYYEQEYITTYQEHCEYVAGLQDAGFDFEGCVIKQADTIEELCDVYIIEKFKHIFTIDEFSKKIVRNCKDSEVYGAIWTDKGLIYVAKMNEKGKLELL